MSDLRQLALAHALISVALACAIPLALWIVLMRNWKPRQRLIYALRFSLWPTIFSTFFLGRPISREIFGIESRYLMGLKETVLGLFGIFMVTAPVFFIAGWWRARKLTTTTHNVENDR